MARKQLDGGGTGTTPPSRTAAGADSAGVPDGLDPVRLGEWLTAFVGATAPVQAVPLGEGRSNLTFRVRDRVGREWVVRRPPLGDRLATANDVVREGQVMAAVRRAGIPAPPLVASCDDLSVIGAPFVVLGLVEGVVLRNRAVALTVDDADRLRVGGDLVDALAMLHELDVEAIGLGHLARPGAYLERQLRRWRRQWDATAADVDALDDVFGWLVDAMPAQQATSLVHGDPKLDNCVLGPGGRLAALLDWELAAVGDPLADLAMLLAYWAEPTDDRYALQDPPTVVAGFPTRADLVERYASRAGLDLDPLPYYLTFTYWKLACIVAGVHRRLVDAGLGRRAIDPAPYAEQVLRLGELAQAAMVDASAR